MIPTISASLVRGRLFLVLYTLHKFNSKNLALSKPKV